jgi:ABC-2 type transport system ATP-binding protein
MLFASLRIANGENVPRFPNGLVAPIRLENVRANQPQEVTISLPAVVAEASAGETLRLVISTTDSAYLNSPTPAVYEIALVDGAINIPTMSLTKISGDASPANWLGIALLVIALCSFVLWIRRPRRNTRQFKAEYENIPLRVENLVKEFKGGQRAVNDITWEVPTGVVLGLLGPNGAGKTTTMRMAMGLIRPTEGAVYVFGHEVQPGSPVLSRIGALVEGAGFLPHLTGRENLMLFWKASGRTTEDPQLDAVLAIADLGTAVDRKVRTYSQGMRQRLGIAQAMLGMPDLLMLDEPTNGLDPPQIKAMRAMMQEYAATGRTVIVSSHLLSEVEQTCSHVIVMHRGKLVTSGKVNELLAGRANMHLEDFFLEVVGDDLTIGKS